MNIRRRPPILLMVSAILIVLLPLLAYLQYDWLGKVSEREREQMQTGLRRTLSQFRADFDREIARVYFQFQTGMAPDSLEPEEYSKLYTHWNETAPYPRLIKDIFLAEGANLKRLDVPGKAWAAASWPSEFGPLRTLAAVDGAIPAVVIPIFQVIPLPVDLVIEPRIQQLIVRLDLAYLQKEFVPALVRTHFGETMSDYRIAVTDGQDSSRIIYSSDEEHPVITDGDAAEDLFAARPGEFRSVVAIPPVASTAERMFDVRVFRSVSGERVHDHVGALAVAIDGGVWRVAAVHRSGSLDAAVGRLRFRNLALSFTILGLLATSMGIVLVSTARAQRLARQQMEFVSTVSHELRTPLAVICSAGENLADGVVRDADQLRNYGRVVRNEGRRLSEMVEQVLTFAGMQSGMKTNAFAPTQIAGVVDRALESLAVPIREHGFEVECNIPDALPPVWADASALTRALQNLIGNALKYSGASRWLGLGASRVGTSVQLVVQDRGIGIASSDLPYIFDPFYRGRAAVEGQIQGSGLGLSLVRDIVAAHGGRISVTSTPGVGSTFTITLPETPS